MQKEKTQEYLINIEYKLNTETKNFKNIIKIKDKEIKNNKERISELLTINKEKISELKNQTKYNNNIKNTYSNK